MNAIICSVWIVNSLYDYSIPLNFMSDTEQPKLQPEYLA